VLIVLISNCAVYGRPKVTKLQFKRKKLTLVVVEDDDSVRSLIYSAVSFTCVMGTFCQLLEDVWFMLSVMLVAFWKHLTLSQQGRNHVFKVGGPIPWSRVLLPFYRKKLDRSTQFGAVGYIITLYLSKSYVKSWGSGLPQPPVVAPMLVSVFWVVFQTLTGASQSFWYS